MRVNSIIFIEKVKRKNVKFIIYLRIGDDFYGRERIYKDLFVIL